MFDTEQRGLEDEKSFDIAGRNASFGHILLHSDRVRFPWHGEGGRDHVHTASSLLPRALTS